MKASAATAATMMTKEGQLGQVDRKTLWAVLGFKGGITQGERRLNWICTSGEEIAAAIAYGTDELGCNTFKIKASRTPKPKAMTNVEHKLVEFFRGEGYTEFGNNGDLEGWDPAETAIRAMRELTAARHSKRLAVAAKDRDDKERDAKDRDCDDGEGGDDGMFDDNMDDNMDDSGDPRDQW